MSLDSNPAKQFQARQAFQGLIELPAVLPTILCAESHGDSLPPKERAALPFLTAQDILRALHMLRC